MLCAVCSASCDLLLLHVPTYLCRLGKLCQFTNTATVQAMHRLCDKLKVANKSQHRLFRKQRRGQKQATMKLEGKQLKRERMVSSQNLALSELELQELLA